MKRRVLIGVAASIAASLFMGFFEGFSAEYEKLPASLVFAGVLVPALAVISIFISYLLKLLEPIWCPANWLNGLRTGDSHAGASVIMSFGGLFPLLLFGMYKVFYHFLTDLPPDFLKKPT